MIIQEMKRDPIAVNTIFELEHPRETPDIDIHDFDSIEDYEPSAGKYVYVT